MHSEGDQAMEDHVDGGGDVGVLEDEALVDNRPLVVELTVSEAEALSSWVGKPTSDGSSAMDDPVANVALTKLLRSIDHARAIDSVRDALEQAGLPSAQLSDDDVLELGQRISKAPLQNSA
jgi:hypothetical protein